jgi:hypothetical protein
MSFNLTNETFVPTLVPTDAPALVPTDIPTSVPTDAPTSVPTDIPTISNITTNSEGTSQSDYSIIIAISVIGCAILSVAGLGVYYSYIKYYKNSNENDINFSLPGETIDVSIDNNVGWGN